MKPPAFIDCYGDLTDRLTSEMLSGLSVIEIFRDEPENEDEFIRRLEGRRNVLVYMGYLSRPVLRACPDLKTVAYLATGLATHGDLDEAERLGLRIEGVKGYGDRAVAEHAIALALSAIKRIAEMDRNIRSGLWQLTRSEEISGKTFGVIGLGGIGCETARIAHALGAKVLGWSRSGNAGNSPVEMVELDQVLADSDILSLHLGHSPQTTGFIDENAFGKMKRGVILVNTARAGIVDEAAMISALASGKVGYCALDVFHDEPVPQTNPLLAMENVVMTSHSAWLTTQAIDRLLVAGLALLVRHIEETAL